MQHIDINDAQLRSQLEQAAAGSQSVDAAARAQAEQLVQHYQDAVSTQTGFAQLLLHMAAAGSPASLFCSVVFKNTIKKCWDARQAEHCITEHDKAEVRAAVVGAVLATAGATQRNLSEAVFLIAGHDFPDVWPTALDELTAVLGGAEVPVPTRVAALATAHHILTKFRSLDGGIDRYVDIMRTIYEIFTAPLVNSMELLWRVACAGGPEAAVACGGVTSCVECLRDLSVFDLGEELLQALDRVATLLLEAVSSSNAALTGANEYQTGPLLTLKSAALDLVTHLLVTFPDDVEKYAPQFLQTALQMLAGPQGRMPAADDVCVRGLELLETACRGPSGQMLAQPETMRELCSSVLTPNLVLSDADMELFDDDPYAYVQREMEGSNMHTRRRAANDLIQALVRHLGQTAAPALLEKLASLRAAGAGGDWRQQEAAIFLATALALDGNVADAQRGAARGSGTLVSLSQIMTESVLPELTSPVSATSHAAVKAACLRAVAVFRRSLDAGTLGVVLGCLPVWLTCGVDVLASFAASVLEKVLDLKTVTQEALAPLAPRLLEALCQLTQEPSEANGHAPLALMRVCRRFPDLAHPFARDVVVCCAAALQRAIAAPPGPLFSHCLFEVLSSCVALAPEGRADFEAALWPHLMDVLQRDVSEYVPYALQLIAQLLRAHAGEAEPPEPYGALLQPLLDPSLYRNRARVPAAASVVRAFVTTFPAYVHGAGASERVLSIATQLVQLKNYDHEGLALMTAVMVSYPTEVTRTYTRGIFVVLLQRLRNASTPKFVRILVLFFSVSVCILGAEGLAAALENIQQGLFVMILGNVWLPNMQKVTGALERKTCVVALTRVLCDVPALQAEPAKWAQGVLACLRMVHTGPEADDHKSFSPTVRTAADLAAPAAAPGAAAAGGGLGGVGVRGVGEEMHSNVHCVLQAAEEAPQDVCADVTDGEVYLRTRMTALLQGPGAAALMPELQNTLTQEQLALLRI